MGGGEVLGDAGRGRGGGVYHGEDGVCVVGQGFVLWGFVSSGLQTKWGRGRP